MAYLVKHRHEASMTPGSPNRIARLKYVSTSEILIEYRQSNARIGRSICKATDWLEEHEDIDVHEAEEFLYSHPDWGPTILCESIRGTVLFNNADSHEHGEFIAQCVQHDLALKLLEHPFTDTARNAVQEMLKHPEMVFVSPEAAYCVLAYFTRHHPNPRKYLERPEVRPKFPDDLEVHLFPAPDFEHEKVDQPLGAALVVEP